MSNFLAFSGIEQVHLSAIQNNTELVDYYFFDVEELLEDTEGSQIIETISLWQRLKSFFNQPDSPVPSAKPALQLPDDWPHEELDYFSVEGLNHRNADLFYEILKTSTKYTDISGAVFGSWFSGNQNAQSLQPDSWFIEHQYIHEIIDCINHLPLQGVAEGYQTWLRNHHKPDQVSKEEAAIFFKELVEFRKQLVTVEKQNQALIWCVS